MRSGNAPPDAPPAPQCTPRPAQVMTCTWSEPRSNGAPITDYRLEMGHGATPTFSTVYQGAQTSCDVKSIPPASLCLFRLQVCLLFCLCVCLLESERDFHLISAIVVTYYKINLDNIAFKKVF